MTLRSAEALLYVYRWKNRGIQGARLVVRTVRFKKWDDFQNLCFQWGQHYLDYPENVVIDGVRFIPPDAPE